MYPAAARNASASIRRYAFDGTSYRSIAGAVEDVRGGATKPGAHRLQFAKGRSSALLPGQAHFRSSDEWVFGARADQTLHLALLPGGAGAVLTLVRATGRSGTMTSRVTRWDGVLPATGDYTVVVEPEGAGPVGYRLQLGIDAAP